jgi:hypothetical protein
MVDGLRNWSARGDAQGDVRLNPRRISSKTRGTAVLTFLPKPREQALVDGRASFGRRGVPGDYLSPALLTLLLLDDAQRLRSFERGRRVERKARGREPRCN